MLGNLEGGADSGEVLHLSTSGASIETLHVATFTLGEWRGDIDFAEVGGADDVACHLSEFVCGRDEAGYCHDTCIDEEFTYLGYATDVFAAVFFGEAEVGVDAGTDVVAVEDSAENAPPVQLAFYADGNGALAATAQAGHLYHDALLTEQLLFVLTGKHLVEDGIY